MAERSKRVVGYARVSVDAPDKVSPEMQAEAIEAQCKLKGWELVDLIVERGRSAGACRIPLSAGGTAHTAVRCRIAPCRPGEIAPHRRVGDAVR